MVSDSQVASIICLLLQHLLAVNNAHGNEPKAAAAAGTGTLPSACLSLLFTPLLAHVHNSGCASGNEGGNVPRALRLLEAVVSNHQHRPRHPPAADGGAGGNCLFGGRPLSLVSSSAAPSSPQLSAFAAPTIHILELLADNEHNLDPTGDSSAACLSPKLTLLEWVRQLARRTAQWQDGGKAR